MNRARHQKGTLYRVKRKHGPAAWEFRWREISANGESVRRSSVIGTINQYPSKSAAHKAADALRITINQPQRHSATMLFSELVAHYLSAELPEDSTRAIIPKSHSHRVTVLRYLRKWVLPRWGAFKATTMAPTDLERWLAELGSQLSNGSRAKIRNVMSSVFRHGMRHGLLPRNDYSNPMQFVRQSAMSEKAHAVLTGDQVCSILNALREPVRTMALLDASTGLRVSELLALKWRDVDFDLLQVNVRQSIVYGVVGNCKSKYSRAPVPLDPRIAAVLESWRVESIYTKPEDWVFASETTGGVRPYWPGSLIKWHLRPAAKKAGISEPVGWHTFRRTLATLLNANDENIKVQQELLRHSTSKVTLDFYSRALTPAKRDAQERVVSMIMPSSAIQ